MGPTDQTGPASFKEHDPGAAGVIAPARVANATDPASVPALARAANRLAPALPKDTVRRAVEAESVVVAHDESALPLAAFAVLFHVPVEIVAEVE